MSRYICKCECGGDVRGVDQFGMTFSVCMRCTPVVRVLIPCPFGGGVGIANIDISRKKREHKYERARRRT